MHTKIIVITSIALSQLISIVYQSKKCLFILQPSSVEHSMNFSPAVVEISFYSFLHLLSMQ